MLHPLIHLIATQPHLLGSHAAAYGELISDELATQAQALKRRTLWGALAVCFLGVAAVLAGVATLLWALLVPALQPVPWAVILVPLVPFVLALVCGLVARTPGTAQDAAFAELRRQVQADMELFAQLGHDMSAPTLTPSERLALSRERLRLAISHNATQAPPPLAALMSGDSTLLDVLKMALPGASEAINALAEWWKEASLRPLVKNHPVALVAGALAAGALLAWARPWRWLFRPQLLNTVGPALLTSVLASGTVQAWILEILAKKPAPPPTPSEPNATNAESPT